MIDRRRFLGSVVFGSTLLAIGERRSLLAVAPATPSAASTGNDEFVVNVDWLQSTISKPEIKILALQDAKAFEVAHLPGAVQIDWPAMEIAETSDASVASWRLAMAARFSALGVEPGDTVVAYDDGTLFSARIWWVLDQIGHPHKGILSGGLNAWTGAGGQTVSGPSAPVPAKTPLTVKANDGGIATIAETIAALDANAVTFIDARSAAEYETGHIPGAKNIPFQLNAAAAPDSRWKTPAQLRELYETAGPTLQTAIIPYCSSGVRSAVTYVALRRAGFTRVALFTGSWNEWSSHPDLPVTTGKEP